MNGSIRWNGLNLYNLFVGGTAAMKQRSGLQSLYIYVSLLLLLYTDQASAYYRYLFKNVPRQDGRPGKERKGVLKAKPHRPGECQHIYLDHNQNIHESQRVDALAVWNMEEASPNETVRAIQLFFRKRCSDPVPYVVVVLDQKNLKGIHYVNFKSLGIWMPVQGYMDLDYEKEIQEGGKLYGLGEEVQGSVLEWDDQGKDWIIFPGVVGHKNNPNPNRFNSQTDQKILKPAFNAQVAIIDAEKALTPEARLTKDTFENSRRSAREDMLAIIAPQGGAAHKNGIRKKGGGRPKKSGSRTENLGSLKTEDLLDETTAIENFPDIPDGINQLEAVLEQHRPDIAHMSQMGPETETDFQIQYPQLQPMFNPQYNPDVSLLAGSLGSFNPQIQIPIQPQMYPQDSLNPDTIANPVETDPYEQWKPPASLPYMTNMVGEDLANVNPRLQSMFNFYLSNSMLGNQYYLQPQTQQKMADLFQDPAPNDFVHSDNLITNDVEDLVARKKPSPNDFFVDDEVVEPFGKKLKPWQTGQLSPGGRPITQDTQLMDHANPFEVEEEFELNPSSNWAAAQKALNQDLASDQPEAPDRR